MWALNRFQSNQFLTPDVIAMYQISIRCIRIRTVCPFFVRRTRLWGFWVETVSISRSTRPAAPHHQSRFRGNIFVSFHRFHLALVIKGCQKEGCTPLKMVPCGDSSLRLAWALPSLFGRCDALPRSICCSRRSRCDIYPYQYNLSTNPNHVELRPSGPLTDQQFMCQLISGWVATLSDRSYIRRLTSEYTRNHSMISLAGFC